MQQSAAMATPSDIPFFVLKQLFVKGFASEADLVAISPNFAEQIPSSLTLLVAQGFVARSDGKLAVTKLGEDHIESIDPSFYQRALRGKSIQTLTAKVKESASSKSVKSRAGASKPQSKGVSAERASDRSDFLRRFLDANPESSVDEMALACGDTRKNVAALMATWFKKEVVEREKKEKKEDGLRYRYWLTDKGRALIDNKPVRGRRSEADEVLSQYKVAETAAVPTPAPKEVRQDSQEDDCAAPDGEMPAIASSEVEVREFAPRSEEDRIGRAIGALVGVIVAEVEQTLVSVLIRRVDQMVAQTIENSLGVAIERAVQSIQDRQMARQAREDQAGQRKGGRNLPRIVIAGTIAPQQRRLEDEFKGEADLRWIEKETLNASRIRALGNSADAIIVWTDFMTHSHVKTFQKCGAKPIFVTGGIESISNEITKFCLEWMD